MAELGALALELLQPRHGDSSANAARVCPTRDEGGQCQRRNITLTLTAALHRRSWNQLYKALLPSLLMVRASGTAMAGATISRPFLDGAQRALQLVLYGRAGGPLGARGGIRH